MTSFFYKALKLHNVQCPVPKGLD